MKILTPLALALAPVSLFAFSINGPPASRTGAPVDGGLTCTMCHLGRAVNSDPRGRLFVQTVAEYRPGVTQKVKVVLTHPEARRWGFQLTARLASDPSRKAGTFAPNDAVRVRCADATTNVSCGNLNEFVLHTAVWTAAGQEGGQEWEFDWTPPAAGSGEVIFYVAGNAANNNGNNSGDTIYNTSSKVFENGACNLTASPTISSVKHAGSLLEGPLSFNTLAAVEGTGLTAPGAVHAGLEYINGNKLPSKLGCVAIEVDGQRAPIYYSQFTQSNIQLPTTAKTGDVQVVAIANPGQSNEIRSAPATIRLAQASPGFIRLLPTPCILAVFPDGSISGDPSLFSYVRGARAGDTLHLYLTGLGATDPVYQAGEIAPSTPVAAAGAITVEFNGTPLAASDVLFAGLSEGWISGLNRITIRVPAANLRPNAHNEVRVRVGSAILSPAGATLFIAPN
jgi:uncharacterized protein (TIGR03437 family)